MLLLSFLLILVPLGLGPVLAPPSPDAPGLCPAPPSLASGRHLEVHAQFSFFDVPAGFVVAVVEL